MNTENTPTVATPATVREAIAGPVAEVLALRVKAEVLREKVDAIAAEVLAAGEYTEEDGGRQRITEPGRAWLMSEARFADFDARVDARVRARVQDGHPEGFCPALMAENARIKAEYRLLEAAAPLFGVKAEQVNRSLKNRARFIELLTKLALAS